MLAEKSDLCASASPQFTDSHLLSNHQQCLPSDIGTAVAPLSARPPSSVPGARKPNDARPQRVHRSCVAFVAFHQQELTSYARVHPSLAASAQPTHPDAVAACGAHMHCGPFTVRSRRSDGNERFNPPCRDLNLPPRRTCLAPLPSSLFHVSSMSIPHPTLSAAPEPAIGCPPFECRCPAVPTLRLDLQHSIGYSPSDNAGKIYFRFSLIDAWTPQMLE
ncbi:hypothetical protein B0H10DRAFT_758182 [Mycena sp. CBHHK59/15]|nr:hypothetical protein B0H10DRAFT_758182 [Mycena sp. CBHHK59/15]